MRPRVRRRGVEHGRRWRSTEPWRCHPSTFCGVERGRVDQSCCFFCCCCSVWRRCRVAGSRTVDGRRSAWDVSCRRNGPRHRPVQCHLRYPVQTVPYRLGPRQPIRGDGRLVCSVSVPVDLLLCSVSVVGRRLFGRRRRPKSGRHLGSAVGESFHPAVLVGFPPRGQIRVERKTMLQLAPREMQVAAS